MSEIAIGLIGLGVHGLRYAGHLVNGDVKGARLVAVCRRDRGLGESFARDHGVSFYQDCRQLVSANDVDAVAVVTPARSHLAVCLAALEAGKPVLVEKPVVGSADQGAVLERAVKTSGVPLMVAQTLRYNPVVRALKERLALVGKPLRFRMALRRPPDARAKAGRLDEPSRGSVLELGVHLFDAVRWIFRDEAERLFCLTDAIVTRNIEDFFSAEVALAGTGVRCSLEVNKCSAARSEPVDLTGDCGQLVGDARTAELIHIGTRGRARLDIGGPVQTVRAALSDFAGCLAQGRPLPIQLGEGLRAVQIAEACYASAGEGRFVEVPTDSAE